MLDADASPGFQPASRDGGMALVEGTAIIWWHQSGTTWNKIDLSTLAGADGNVHTVNRTGNATGVVPTVGEIPVAINGDIANVFNSGDGTLEIYTYNGTIWTLWQTITSDKLSSLALGTLTATTVPITNTNGTGVTLVAATVTEAGVMTAQNVVDLAAAAKSVTDTNTVDLTLAAGALSADLKIDATQDANYTVTQSATGTRLTQLAKKGPFNTHALAAVDADVIAGREYYLAVTNLEGVVSAGSKGPFFVI
jgi:hypothetical protein